MKVRQWIRQALFGNLVLKVLSLALAVLLFIVVHSERQSVVQGNVGVSYSAPAGRVLESKPPATLLVGVSGPVSRLQRFRIDDLAAVSIDLTDVKEGYFRFRDELLALPPGLRVAFVRPPGFTVRFEPTMQRRLPLRLMVVGDPAPGHRVTGRHVRPSRVMVHGPRSAVQGLSELRTDAVAIDGADTTQVRRVRIPTPTGVEVEGGAEVEATVEIGKAKDSAR